MGIRDSPGIGGILGILAVLVSVSVFVSTRGGDFSFPSSNGCAGVSHAERSLCS